MAVADAKLEILEEGGVVKDVEGVEDIKLVTLSEHEGVRHQLGQRRLGIKVVVAVGRVKGAVLVVAENGGGQSVEGEHVRDLLGLDVLDHVRIDDVGLRQHPVLELGHRELRREEVAAEERVELGGANLAIGLAQLAQAARHGRVGQRIKLESARDGHARREAREADFDELLRVERAVPVPAACDRLWQHDACRVCSLEDLAHVDAPCDLLDEDGRETLGAQLLVDAEEVDLHDRILRRAAAALGRCRGRIL
mmetsp:Transcript_40908/g.112483  ORF Transcript_40908/g.112483 Transcript_40908/m.112483 type:complete len:252 (-) Transcript_40908:723-1478(-)